MARSAKDPGDLQAYVKLMTAHQGNLRAFIVSLIPGSPDVADVLQETNVALWQKRERFKLGTNFLAWAFQIARYEVQRQRARTMRVERLAFSENLVTLLGTMEAPDESAEEVMAALDGCIEKLTEPQRELVFARYTPGQSIEQLAARAGRSAGSLRISLLRIREMLKLCVEKALAGQSA